MTDHVKYTFIQRPLAYSFPSSCIGGGGGSCGGTGGGCVGAVYVTVTAALAGLPAASRAVTVITLSPGFRSTATFQFVVPVAVPEPPRLFTQLTCVTPTLSDAVPAIG